MTGNRNLGTDFAGRAIIQNAIYDPSTATTDSSGRRVLNVFPNNVIPQNRIDPVAVKIMALFPKPNLGNDLFVNNFAQSGAFYKLQQIPSIKIDQNFGSKIKLSGYYATQSTDQVEWRGRIARGPVDRPHTGDLQQDGAREFRLHHLADAAFPL